MNDGRRGLSFFGLLLALCLTVTGPLVAARASAATDPLYVLSQQPATGSLASPSGGMLEAGCGEGARIVLLGPASKTRVLTGDFHSACDPEVSFDGKRLLFAGQPEAGAPWNVFEMTLDDGKVRQVTDDAGDARHPVYLGTFYTIDAEAPRYQIAFVSTRAGELNETAGAESTSLYTCAMDGSLVRRVTYNPSSDADPTTLPDGRLLFSSWQRSNLDRGAFGRIALFAAQTDGLDYAIFSGDEGLRIKRMPCVTRDRLVVFVESDEPSPDGAGTLASVSLRRNLHSYRRITTPGDGLFHSPSPLADGAVLVSRRSTGGGDTYGVFRLDPTSGALEPLFDDPDRHDLQARLVGPRPEPDGRSSVLTDKNPNGVLYGLDVYDSDLGERWVAPRTPLRLRVLEGLPRHADAPAAGDEPPGAPPLLQRRFLGEVAVAEDGSFNVEIPANLPVELQLVDADGFALRRCSWIWVRNRETRGCIGCHEDGERTPENRFVEALKHPSIPLVLPEDRRRTVDFRRDVAPILATKCGGAACHAPAQAAPVLAGAPAERIYEALLQPASSAGSATSGRGSYVDPGRARTSPLVWYTSGRVTSRPWDGTPPAGEYAPMPPEGAEPLTDDERRTLIEWIDLGAMWSGPEADARTSREGAGTKGGTK